MELEQPFLICDKTSGMEAILGLPPSGHNVFQRIIRNPRPDSPIARERECTEMLAAVLLNAPTLRQQLFRWMATRSGTDPKALDDLSFEIRTEQYIGAKRDDLRIEGFKKVGNDEIPIFVWTIELKVGSSFHVSRVQHLVADGEDSDDAETDIETDEELVNQLRHYDDWLGLRALTHCGGFVLALRDLTESLPPLGLKHCWTCLTWTGLGLEIKLALEGDLLPPTEQFLARHLLGFISTNLWRTEEMPDELTRLEFNDIALIRAFSRSGRDIERRMEQLATSLEPIFEESRVGAGPIKSFSRLYKTNGCVGLYRSFAKGLMKDSDPYLTIALGAEPSDDYVGVFLEFSAAYLKKSGVKNAVAKSLEALKKLNSNWKDGGEGDEPPIALSVPLTDLLAANDQQAMLQSFTKQALSNLKDAKVIESIVSAIEKA